MRARKEGGVEVVLKIINNHGKKQKKFLSRCFPLSIISEADYSAQKEVCERGGIDTLLNVFGSHRGSSKEVFEICCRALCVILSSQNTYSRFCTDDVLAAVQECCEVYEDSVIILQSLLSLMRNDDPRVKDAVTRGVCTKKAFPKCGNECGCDEGIYCPKCCVQQKVFRCLTCDKDKVKLYCETCWKRDHQGHECEEFFYPVRCRTK